MRTSEELANLTAALCGFQGEIENPKNTSVNPQFRSKYAPLDVVINTVKPILLKHGLSFTQSTGSVDENIVISTRLMHKSGEWIESEPLILPAYQIGKGGSRTFNAQGAGSAITYGRRYSLTALLGISSEDDDDGNHASENKGNGNTPKPKQNAPQGELSVEKLQSIVKGKKVAATKKFNVSFEEVDKKILEQVPEWHGFTNKPEKLKAAKELLESWGC